MTGLQRFFMRITPIIMLICFICFGISHAFNNNSITYLTQETITIDDKNTQTTDDDITIKNYTFNFSEYIENANANRLVDAVTITLNIESWQKTIQRFNMLWEDGYNVGDILQTILNGILLLANGFITGINLIISPIKITAGIILTALAIGGINITNNTTILITLNGIIDYVTIPLITPTYDNQSYAKYNGTTWQFIETIDLTNKTEVWNMTINVTFTTQAGGNYKKIIVNKTNNSITYVDNDNYQIQVYNLNTGWIYQDSKRITINQNNTLSREDYLNLDALLQAYAIEIAE